MKVEHEVKLDMKWEYMRRYASAGYSDRNVSVRLSVCPSVTRRYCVKTKKASGMISSPSDSP